MGRLDFIKYDEHAQAQQMIFKARVGEVMDLVAEIGVDPTKPVDAQYVPGEVIRNKSLALTHLEIAYAFIGKAIRDEQLNRDRQAGVKSELQEGRVTS